MPFTILRNASFRAAIIVRVQRERERAIDSPLGGRFSRLNAIVRLVLQRFMTSAPLSSARRGGEHLHAAAAAVASTIALQNAIVIRMRSGCVALRCAHQNA